MHNRYSFLCIFSTVLACTEVKGPKPGIQSHVKYSKLCNGRITLEMCVGLEALSEVTMRRALSSGKSARISDNFRANLRLFQIEPQPQFFV
jgi:hypothetical protein